MQKTNAMRVLDARNLQYTAHWYDDTIKSGQGVSDALGIPLAQVFKTLVAMRERGRPLLVMVSSDRELDLKKLATAVGEKRLRMATQREAETKTGLRVGGIGALALLDKGFECVLDASAQQWEQVLVNGGQRGLNLEVGVADLVNVTGALVADVSTGLAEGN